MNNTTFVRTILVGLIGVIFVGTTYIFLIIRHNENTPRIVMPNNPAEDGRDHTVDIARNTPPPSQTTSTNASVEPNDITPSTTALKADVVTTTAYFNGQKAIKYTDKIGDFSITVPATWVVEYGINSDKNKNEGTYMTIFEPIVDTFSPFPKGFIIHTTELPFEGYMYKGSSGTGLPKLEFYKVYSYNFKGLPAIHWEQDTHIGITSITDFILRKYKKYNLAIEENEGKSTNDAELNQIINSLKL